MTDNAPEISLDQVAERIAREVGIPPCPKILLDLVIETRADEPNYRRVADLIQRDVALAATVLATANSSFYGYATKAATIREACMMLGLRTTSYLVTGLLLRRVFPSHSSPAMERFWALSSATAEAASIMARQLKAADRDIAHTYGLFRDCGLAVLSRHFADYADIIDGSATDGTEPIVAVELRRYGIHHAQVGMLLAREWLLPQAMCDAIGRHHDYAALTEDARGLGLETRRLMALGILAENRYWLTQERRDGSEWELGKTGALQLLGIDETALDKLGVEHAGD